MKKSEFNKFLKFLNIEKDVLVAVLNNECCPYDSDPENDLQLACDVTDEITCDECWNKYLDDNLERD